MKYCPNPECRQEYRDEAAACTDCGAELTTVPPVWPAAAPATAGVLWIRLALTVVVPALVVGLSPKVPLPRIDSDRLAETLGPYAGQVNLSVFALGLIPIVSAFLLVELAALCVPRWRPLRTGGPAGRARLLVAVGWLGLVLAGVQAVGLTRYLERMGALEADTRLSRLVVVFTLVAGTWVLVAVVQLLDRAALGGGFALLTTAFTAAALWPSLPPLAGVALGPLMIVLAVAGPVFFLRWRPAGALPLPACGLVPLEWSAVPAAAALVLARFGIWPEALGALAEEQGTRALAISLTLTVALAVGLAFLFNRPGKVAAFVPDAGGRVRRSVAYSTAFVLGLAALGWLIGRQIAVYSLSFFSLVPLVAVVALVLDVIAEARAIHTHGELVPVWPEHRLYAVESALDALGRSGIPGLARSRHQRVLWHFFAPFIPIQIMVPRAHAEEAGRLLHEHFGAAPEGPDGAPQPAE